MPYCQLHINAFVCLDCIFDLHRWCQKHRIRCHSVVACHLECCLVSCQLKCLCRWTVPAYKCKQTTTWLYERPLFKWTVIVLFVRLNNSITVSQRFTYARRTKGKQQNGMLNNITPFNIHEHLVTNTKYASRQSLSCFTENVIRSKKTDSILYFIQPINFTNHYEQTLQQQY